MADEEQERNVVPIEEALAISDRDSLRTLIMNVVRGDVTDSLGSLALALDSEDTETSHYAAAVLRDVLNDFRQHAQKLYRQMQKDGREAGDDACLLIEYMSVSYTHLVAPDYLYHTSPADCGDGGFPLSDSEICAESDDSLYDPQTVGGGERAGAFPYAWRRGDHGDSKRERKRDARACKKQKIGV